MGLEIASVGIRDVILPGEMKDLMNKVTEARKAAEANLIARREETAAIRSQANTARLLADSPSMEFLRQEAKDLLSVVRESDGRATLADAQRAIAEEYERLWEAARVP